MSLGITDLAAAGMTYRVGTVSGASGSTTLTFVGTALALAGIRTGDYISIPGLLPHAIVSVTSDTTLTIDAPLPSAVASGTSYVIQRHANDSVEVSAAIRELLLRLPPMASLLKKRTFATRADAIAAVMDARTTTIEIEGRDAANDDGGGVYIQLPSAPTVVRSWHLQNAASLKWYELRQFGHRPKQFGAKLDNATDDSAPMQDWLDYALNVPLRTPCYGDEGTARVPTATLSGGSRVIIDGLNRLKIRRDGESRAPVFQASGATAPIIRNIEIIRTGGATSTSSNSVGIGSKTFASQGGLSFAAGDPLIVVAAGASPAAANYMIGTVTSYSAGTVVANITAAVGSGTFTSWELDINSGEGAGIRYVNCTGGLIENVEVSGRFYVSVYLQNGTGNRVVGNRALGAINRLFYMLGSSGTSDNNTFANNVADGQFRCQYGFNANGSGGFIKNLAANDNHIQNCGFQGAEIGGNCQNCTISGGSIESIFGPSSVALLFQRANGVQPQHLTASNVNIANCAGTGAMMVDTLYCVLSVISISNTPTGILMQQSATGIVCHYNAIIGAKINGATLKSIVITGVQANFVGLGIISGVICVGGSGATDGIETAANSNGMVIVGNRVSNHTTNYDIQGVGHTYLATANG